MAQPTTFISQPSGPVQREQAFVSCHTIGSALVIILGIGALATLGVGYFRAGTLSNIDQIRWIILLAASGGGGALCLVGGIVSFIKSLPSKVEPEGASEAEDVQTEPKPVASGQSSFLYETFYHYHTVRISQGEPVDIIVGRGRAENPKYPKLHDRRYYFIPDKETSYQPFMIDIAGETKPDYVGDISDVKSMEYFSDNIVDEIYLEGIYPTSPLLDPKTYCNAARILRMGGVLIIDLNSLCQPIQVLKLESKFVEIFTEFCIPLVAYPCQNLERNDYYKKEHKMAFLKDNYYETDILLRPSKLLQAQQKLFDACNEVKNSSSHSSSL